MYCLISLFVFSIVPFCHEQYGSAKYTGTPKNFVMSLRAANSGPLSVVIFLHHACKTVACGECYQFISNMGEASVCIRLISSDF